MYSRLSVSSVASCSSLLCPCLHERRVGFMIARRAKNFFALLARRSHCQRARALITLSAEACDECHSRERASSHTRGSGELVMQRQLTAFVEQPSKATYLAARDAVLRDSPLPIVAADLADLGAAARSGGVRSGSGSHRCAAEFEGARAARALPGGRSGRSAARLRYASSWNGRCSCSRCRARWRRATARASNPYIVCHATDEYDILAALGREPAGQSLEEHEGQLFDVLTCDDGREVWFDVTAILVRPQPQKRAARAT